MNEDAYVAPSYKALAFTCPHCGVCTAQSWGKACLTDDSGEKHELLEGMEVTKCAQCGGSTVWSDGKRIAPLARLGSPPHPGFSAGCCAWYEEARAVATLSPRSACALLRAVIYSMVMPDESIRYKSMARRVAGLALRGVIPRSLEEELRRLCVIGPGTEPAYSLRNNENLELAEAMLAVTARLAEHLLPMPDKTAEEKETAPEQVTES